jgi:hypothetical protein
MRGGGAGGGIATGTKHTMQLTSFASQGVRDSLDKITATANALKDEIEVMKTERWKGCELGDWRDWSEDKER